jgi:hypothetical protein
LSVVEDKELTCLPEPREAEAKKKTLKIKLPSFMKKK